MDPLPLPSNMDEAETVNLRTLSDFHNGSGADCIS